jgi:hypothetical protein
VRHPWHIVSGPLAAVSEQVLDILSGVVIGLHLVSIHVPQQEGQRNFNPGIYVRDSETGLTAGTYRNTLGKQTFYVGETVTFHRFSITFGIATGYQRRTSVVACNPEQSLYWSRCYSTTRGAKTYLTPVVAPSVRLPQVFGATPRLSFMPGMAGTSNVFHLSVEGRF